MYFWGAPGGRRTGRSPFRSAGPLLAGVPGACSKRKDRKGLIWPLDSPRPVRRPLRRPLAFFSLDGPRCSQDASKTPPKRLLIVFFLASVFQCLFGSIFMNFQRQLGTNLASKIDKKPIKKSIKGLIKFSSLYFS